MKRRIFAIVATAFAILPLGVNAAQNNFGDNNIHHHQMAHNHRSGNKRKGGGEGMEKLLQQLDLTSEQSQQINAIKENFATENEALHGEMTANREQMRSLFETNASSEELRQQHQQAQNLHQQLSNNRFEMMLQVREVLTPEQRTKMTELRAQHRERKGER